MSARAPEPVRDEPPLSGPGGLGRSGGAPVRLLGDGAASAGASAPGARRPRLADAVAALERRLIEEALRDARGNAAQAARLLGTTERIVRYKAGKLGIDRRAFRS